MVSHELHRFLAGDPTVEPAAFSGILDNEFGRITVSPIFAVFPGIDANAGLVDTVRV